MLQVCYHHHFCYHHCYYYSFNDIIVIIIIIIIITALGIHTIFTQFSANNININKLAEWKYSEKFVQKLFAVICNENRLTDSEIFFAEV